jgi:hypothetical protein
LSSGNFLNKYHIAQEDTIKWPHPKKKSIVLQRCWKLLEYKDKWKLRDQDAPPPIKGTHIGI